MPDIGVDSGAKISYIIITILFIIGIVVIVKYFNTKKP